MNMEERAARGFEICLPSMILNNAEPQRLKRDGERGNKGDDEVHNAFYGYKTHRLKKGRRPPPPQAVELSDNHDNFLSQYISVHSIHFIKDK